MFGYGRWNPMLNVYFILCKINMYKYKYIYVHTPNNKFPKN